MAEANRKSLRRKSLPQTTREKAEKTRVEAERRSVGKHNDEQNSGKARVNAERRSVVKLTAKQKYNKASRLEVERRIGESLQACSNRLIDKRHCYATRSATVADRVASSVLVLGKETHVAEKKSDSAST